MIKILSESTINRIAAGEVVERPASVIKELVENSIDAGASKINIIIEQAGKNLILIADDGAGMSPEDLKLAVKRHATSKLDEDKLDEIDSFGFRGEALPSISSISRLTITSKRQGSDKAYALSQVGGKDTSIKQVSHDNGTRTEVRDLFFATPARLKFLRTDKTEYAACVDVIKKLALAHPNISFSASHDSKVFLKVKASTNDKSDKISAIKQRVADIIGNDFMNNNAEISLSRDKISIYGFTSLPSHTRTTFEDQHIFVNNRPVKDKLLNMAVRHAYADYVPAGKYPTIILFVDINVKDIDVNVHPAKSEVRFSDPNLVRSLIISSLRDALNSNLSTPGMQLKNPLGHFANNSYSSYLNSPINFSKTNDSFGKNNLYKNQDTYSQQSVGEQNYNSKAFTIPLLATPSQTEIDIRSNNIVQDDILENFTLGSAKTQLGYYIISKNLTGIIIIDLRLASKLLIYEKLKQQFANNSLTKQRILMPEVVEFSDKEKAQAVFSRSKELTKLGISIERFGDKSLIIPEIPNIIGEINIIQFISDLADYLSADEEYINEATLTEFVIKLYAHYHSIIADKKLPIHELNELLREIEQSSFFNDHKLKQTIYLDFKLTDLEKLFARN